MILDVGCRTRGEGDVNIDVVRQNPNKIKNFIQADAHFLPFRDNILSCVICRHALEHLKNPLIALKEIKRVCNGKVLFFIPSTFSLDHEKRHLYSWTPFTLKNLLNKVFTKVEVCYSKRKDVLRGKVGRWMPCVWLNTYLSFFGVRPEIYAIARTRS